jgi:hypothetical protein
MTSQSKIHYEPHPVSAERKAELRAQGLTIVDAVFAPKVEEQTEQKTEVGMTKAELQAALDAKGIAHKPAMSKAELQAMLDAAQ